MTAAIYARKSTDQAGVSDDQRSVARQIDHARQYAARKGWAVLDEHVYVDDGISGAEFANRPGFLRLMNTLKPRAPFQVLVMSEESRLGREAIETAYALKQIVQAKVRVFFYLEDRERTLDTPTDKIMMSLTAFADELEREKARQRTYDAMARKARHQHVTGGRTFGYDNVDVLGADGIRSHVERRINEAEACVVREIFKLCGEGFGVKRIALALNGAGAVRPRPQQARPAGWAPSSVRAVLYRPLYRGLVVWNQTKKRDAWGRAKRQARPEREWVQIEAPTLRIVDDGLWQAAHGRLAAARQTYLRGTRGELWGRPPSGTAAKYLLTGLSRCGLCGGSLMVKSRAHGRKRSYRYACSSYHLRGTSICTNKLELPLADADAAILDLVETTVLQHDVVDDVFDGALLELSTVANDDERRAVLQGDISGLDVELSRLTTALAHGGEMDALIGAIKGRQQQRDAKAQRLRSLDGFRSSAQTDRGVLEGQVEQRLSDWRGLLSRKAACSRQVLTKLLQGRITFTPTTADDGAPACDYAVEFTLGRFFSGILCPKGMASPSGTAQTLDAELTVKWTVAA